MFNKHKILTALIILVYILIYYYRFNNSHEINIKAYIPKIFPNISNYLDQRLAALLPSPQAELLSGILLGQQKNLPGDFKLALKNTSTIHIVVVSGENLTLLAGFMMNLAGVFSRRVAILGSILAICFYVLLTGAQVPVLRAGIMSFLAFLGSIFGRQRDSVWILLISGAVLLLINPSWLTNLSFQLSFLASMGVILVAPVLFQSIKHFGFLIAEDLSVTLGAQLMVTPVIIQNFHQLSIVGLLANLLVGWTVPFIMVGGGVVLICAVVFMPLAQIIVWPLNSLLTYFIYIVDCFGSLSFSWMYVGEQSLWFWVGYYLIIIGILVWMKNRSG